MTVDMLKMSWDFSPDRINTSHDEGGLHQQLVYDYSIIGHGMKFVYVDNGIVTSWQEESQ